ncbi:MAG: hypothetical protein WDA68_07500 [Phycisphaerae bacterium]
MFKRIGDFFVNHIEKIASALIGLVCLIILLTRVLMSPNYVTYQGRKFTAGEIDDRIKRDAEQLRENLTAPAKPKPAYESKLETFVANFTSPLAGISDVPMPYPTVVVRQDSVRKYSVPAIERVEDAKAELIRAVAYVPNTEININTLYDNRTSEPNDIDLVTVEAKFNTAQVYNSFYAAYAGDKVPAEWRDPCLAKPIFAAVQLQRQEKLSGGNWSEWKQIPRTRIDHMRSMLEIVEDIDNLPRGGMRVKMLQLDRPEVMQNILQPAAYNIASAYEEWFPPSLHRKFLKLYADEKAAERREAMAKEREARERETASRQREDQRRTTPTPGRPGSDAVGPPGMGSSPRDRITRDPRRTVEPQPPTARPRELPQRDTVESVYAEMEQLRITPQTDIAQMKDLLIWAHDDTVLPGKTYRYRIRVGVLNPLAGTDSFVEGNETYRNKVILWGGFSETEPIEIPAKIYFFPVDIQEPVNIVKVEVAKYELGYWYNSDFLVKYGETIGKPKEQTATEEEIAKKILIPSQVDYTTGAFMVDVASVEDWEVSRVLRPRSYLEMYYSYDGIDINNMPIRQRNWASEVQSRYTEIRNLIRQPKEPLKPWGGTTGEHRREFLPPPGVPDSLLDPPMPPTR